MVMKRRSYKTVNYFLVHSLSLLIEKPIGERMPQQATGFKFILFSNVLKVPLFWLSWFSFIQLITTFHPFTTSSMGKHYKFFDWEVLMQIELEANESWANFFLLPAIGDHDKNLLGQEDRREARYGVGCVCAAEGWGRGSPLGFNIEK